MRIYNYFKIGILSKFKSNDVITIAKTIPNSSIKLIDGWYYIAHLPTYYYDAVNVSYSNYSDNYFVIPSEEWLKIRNTINQIKVVSDATNDVYTITMLPKGHSQYVFDPRNVNNIHPTNWYTYYNSYGDGGHNFYYTEVYHSGTAQMIGSDYTCLIYHDRKTDYGIEVVSFNSDNRWYKNGSLFDNLKVLQSSFKLFVKE